MLLVRGWSRGGKGVIQDSVPVHPTSIYSPRGHQKLLCSLWVHMEPIKGSAKREREREGKKGSEGGTRSRMWVVKKQDVSCPHPALLHGVGVGVNPLDLTGQEAKGGGEKGGILQKSWNGKACG